MLKPKKKYLKKKERVLKCMYRRLILQIKLTKHYQQ